MQRDLDEARAAGGPGAARGRCAGCGSQPQSAQRGPQGAPGGLGQRVSRPTTAAHAADAVGADQAGAGHHSALAQGEPPIYILS